MKKIILANWKAQFSLAQARKWLAAFEGFYKADSTLQVVLAPSFLALPLLRTEYEHLENISWAAQDTSPYPPGNYTGAVPAAWLADMAEFVLIGHRERRRYFNETEQDAARKIREAVAVGLKPVLCMDRDIAGRQIAALDSSDIENLIIAYTPDDAVALEISRSKEAVAETADYFAALTNGRPVLYGGGVHADNVAEIVAMPQLSGVMTASGCLEPKGFANLLLNAGRALL